MRYRVTIEDHLIADAQYAADSAKLNAISASAPESLLCSPI